MKPILNAVDTSELCSYGCEQQAKYINGSGNYMCCISSNKCPANRNKNSKGIKKAYAGGKRKSASVRYADLPQETKDKMAWNRGIFTGTSFTYDGKGNHKKFLIQERGHRCERCSLTEWLGADITLELEHKDGDNRNNEKHNLELLCPNCHSLTDTWRGRNLVKKKTKNYVSDEEFLDALSSTKNIRQALLKLELTPKGANYERADKLLKGDVVKLANTSDLSSDASA